MDSRKLGYYLMCISPLISLLVVWIVSRSMVGYIIFNQWEYDWRIPLFGMTLANASINGLQVGGLLLYLIGCRRKKEKLVQPLYSKLIAASLIVWGIVVSWFMYTIYYHEVILWSMEPDVRELVIWDHLEFATWILKGVLWVIAGVVIGLTSKPKQRNEAFDCSHL
jgi:hypothetical protein